MRDPYPTTIMRSFAAIVHTYRSLRFRVELCKERLLHRRIVVSHRASSVAIAAAYVIIAMPSRRNNTAPPYVSTRFMRRIYASFDRDRISLIYSLDSAIVPNCVGRRDESIYLYTHLHVHSCIVRSYKETASISCGQASETFASTFAGWREVVAVVPMRYVNVDVGKDLKLACNNESASPSRSDELVGVMWVREGREDGQIERLKVEPNGVLELLNVSTDDAGNYSCTLDDDHDAVKARINVEVRSAL